jgi:hypothetical protein
MLHVVWKQDRLDIKRNIPQLELCNRIPKIMLDSYAGWMAKPVFIPCELSASKTGYNKWENWASQLLIMRLNRKMHLILDSLRLNQYHWEEQLWWMMARNFGNPVNASAFESIARSIPYSLLAKHRHHFIQLEALFIGQANLLDKDFHDPYPTMLKKEYEFLRKISFKKIYELAFIMMRPKIFHASDYPQLAAVCFQSTALFGDGFGM